jgi:hypothetical protein
MYGIPRSPTVRTSGRSGATKLPEYAWFGIGSDHFPVFAVFEWQ